MGYGARQSAGPLLPHVVHVGAGDVAVHHPLLDGAPEPGGALSGHGGLHPVHQVYAERPRNAARVRVLPLLRGGRGHEAGGPQPAGHRVCLQVGNQGVGGGDDGRAYNVHGVRVARPFVLDERDVQPEHLRGLLRSRMAQEQVAGLVGAAMGTWMVAATVHQSTVHSTMLGGESGILGPDARPGQHLAPCRGALVGSVHRTSRDADIASLLHRSGGGLGVEACCAHVCHHGRVDHLSVPPEDV
mmetsp:Transcript_4680/g.9513  ORF Transcript_4680/g.9513 Transcript_4680/m.9513 type:complete len:243 (+) Transcript_4680:888-1616(+)